MTTPAPTVDERLAALAAGHFDADVEMPAILDVTGASPEAVDAVRGLPLITYQRTDEAVPPRISVGSDLCVPAPLADALAAAVRRNPIASVMLVQLVRATAGLPIADALAMESITYSALQAGAEYRAWLSGRPEVTPTDVAPRIAVTSDAGRTIVTLQRPERANALDTRARHELVEAFTALRHDGGPVLLRGAGAHFCAGGDLEEFSSPADITATHSLRLRQGLPLSTARIASQLEVAVHGAVIGAGLELSAFAAHVSATPDARFRLPEIRMGLLPGSGGTVSVPRRIGPNRALILMLSGTVLSAATALTWGLIDELTA